MSKSILYPPAIKSAFDKICFCVATFGFSGCLKPAPGTWGSFATTIVCYLLALFTPVNFLYVAIFLFLIGWYATYIVEKRLGHDPSSIVIDEAVAIFFLNFFVVFLLQIPHPESLATNAKNLAFGFGISFVLFRIFDIWKPGPIRTLDQKLHSAFGTMIDDVLAAIFALPLILIILMLLLTYNFFHLA